MGNSYHQTKYAALVLLCAVNFQLYGEAASELSAWQFEATTMWESRYVDSGREDLDDSGIFSGEVSGSYDALILGAWLGVADSEHYQELNLFAAYGFRIAGVELELAYTHLEFEPASENDDELSIEAETEVVGGFVLGAGGVYSFEAEGSFFEIGLAYPIDFAEERLWVISSAYAGFDFGYRSHAHDGLNHIQVGLDLEYVVTERTTLIAYVAHSFAQDDVEREDLGDVSWFGLGLSAQF
jgi:hypothetical protein